MRRAMILLVLAATGCSMHPVADFMDFAMRPAGVRGPGRGGVCQPAPMLNTPAAPVTTPAARIEAPPPEPPPSPP